MKKTFVKIGGTRIGEGNRCFIVAEIGINHNGDVKTAQELIDAASSCGCDAVKFQKRNPHISVQPHMRGKIRQTPWGEMTYLEYRERLEFRLDEYEQIDAHCRRRNIKWFASCWDIPSVDFMEQFDPICHKISSACLADDRLLTYIAAKSRPVIMSTGMSSIDQISHAVSLLDKTNLVLLHTVAAYPARNEELNLMTIRTLREAFGVPIGYSGHEVGLQTSVAAVALGAAVLERHITLDRSMWGTDQSASVEVEGLRRLVRDIRVVEAAMGDGVKRVLESETEAMLKLRTC